MNVVISVPSAEPRPGCHCPSTFSVNLDHIERDALYGIRQGLVESGQLVNRRSANTVSGPELIRWLLRRVAGVDDKAPDMPERSTVDA